MCLGGLEMIIKWRPTSLSELTRKRFNRWSYKDD